MSKLAPRSGCRGAPPSVAETDAARASVVAGAGVDDRVDRLVHVVRDHP
jgi:hypothetical protein